MPGDDEVGPTSKLVDGLAALQTLAECAVGYHTKLIAGGIPADVAATMTVHFHDLLMSQTRKAMGG